MANNNHGSTRDWAVRASQLVALAFVLLCLPGQVAAQMPVVERTLVQGGYTVTGNDFMDCESGSSCDNNSGALIPVDADPLSLGDIDGDSADDTLASSAATLTLPAGATVVRGTLIVGQRNSTATLYQYPTSLATYDLLFAQPGQGYAPVAAASVELKAGSSPSYQARYDVTAQVRNAGSGSYWVADMQFAPPTARSVTSFWFLLVVYELPGAPTRQITEYGKAQRVCWISEETTTLEFTTPASGTPQSQLTIFAGDGHPDGAGVQVLFDGTPLSNPVNPSDNIGNSTVSGETGALVRDPAAFLVSESVDIDTFDVSPLVSSSQMNATMTMKCANLDGIEWVGAVHSVDVVAPSVTIDKTALDLNGGDVEVGDELEYTIVITTVASDDAVDLVVSDALPAELVYVPGTLEVLSGAGAGPLSDGPGNDQGEVVDGLITVRIGAGADATNGGEQAIGESTTLRFHATVSAVNQSGVVVNQASISFAGASAPSLSFVVSSELSVTPVSSGVTLCGDSIISGGETCDDGNARGDDGCDETCQVEDGFVCESGVPSVCATCFDDADGAATDTGCMDDAPFCATSGGATACVVCQDDLIGGIDLGCS
ncbi:MAG: putative repeat protein (TIGR01451 family), partial [Myxococcota bacterium]